MTVGEMIEKLRKFRGPERDVIMTVAELIEILQGYDPKMQVFAWNNWDYFQLQGKDNISIESDRGIDYLAISTPEDPDLIPSEVLL